MRAREVAREEPVGRPLAEAAERDEPGGHLLVRQRRELVEIEVAPRQPDHVLRLPVREADREQLVLGRLGNPLAGRERVRVLVGGPVALDEAAPDRRRRLERDLLRRDRGDERLERAHLQRRPEAGERARRAGRASGSPAAHAAKPSRSNGRPRKCSTSARPPIVVRRDVDAARRSLDPQLAAGEDAVDPALAPDGRAVEPVDVEAGGRDLEVVRLRERDEHGAMLSSRPRGLPMSEHAPPRRHRALPARPAASAGGRPLVGGASDRDRRRGGPARRLGRPFKPQKPLTQRALGAALETLSLAAEEPVAYRYPVVVARPRRHDPRARRRARRLPRPRRLRPLVTARSATPASRRRRAPGRRPSPACSGSASITPPPRTRSSSA